MEVSRKRGIADRDSVFDAANELLNRGKLPTIIAVRQRIGGGSNSTITKHLQDFRDMQERGRLEKKELVTSQHKEIAQGLEEVFNQLYVLTERTVTTDRIVTLEAENERLRNEIEKLEDELMGFHEMKGKLEALEQFSKESQSQLIATVERQGKENTELREQVKQLQESMSSLMRQQDNKK